MKRTVKQNMVVLSAFVVVLLSNSVARAHFIWLKSSLTDAGARAVISFGESAFEEDYHLPESVESSSLWWRGAQTADKGALNAESLNKRGGEKTHPLVTERVDTDDRVVLEASLPSGDPRVLEATCTYGLYHGSLLQYYAKHIHCKSAKELGDFGPSKSLKLDLVPRATAEGIELTVYWEGQPLPDVKLTLSVDESDEQQTGTTDKEGRVVFSTPAKGLVSVLGHYLETKGLETKGLKKQVSGELDGKAYESISHYATLTFASHAEALHAEKGAAVSPSVSQQELAAGEFPALPEAVASFGGAVHEGWLYVYSGHTGTAHAHSVENLSPHFCRLQLDGGKAWESLPLEQALQGFPLVAHGKSVYRMGGMLAKNRADEEDDLHSVDHFSRFDVETKQWVALPALPEARSSHDAVVLGDKLYVAGGWWLQGEDESEWHTKSLVFDLSKGAQGEWLELPEQPFERRALATSHWQGKLAVIGGIDSDGEVSRKLDLYDPATKNWSEGPELPGTRMSGFGVSAWNSNEKLLVSGLDGILYQLTDDGKAWQPVAKLETARFFHRLLPAGKDRVLPAGKERLLVVGGASFASGHLDDVEMLEFSHE